MKAFRTLWPAFLPAALAATVLFAAGATWLYDRQVASALAPLAVGDRAVPGALLASRSSVFFWKALGTGALVMLIPAAALVLRRRRILASIDTLADAARRAAGEEGNGDLPLPDDDHVAELGVAINRMRRVILTKAEEADEERRVAYSVISGMREGLVWVGPGRRIRLANDTFRQIFMLGGDPTGSLLAEVVRNPAVMRELDAALTEGRGHGEAFFSMPSSGRSFEIRVTPLSGRGGERLGALILFFDVTRLEALERVRRDFVANVSHELRTPLTSIKAFVETLLDEGLQDREHSARFLEIVRKHTDRMGELIDDLTDLSLIETGAVSLDVRDLDAHELVKDVAAQLAFKAADAGIEIRNQVPSPFPLRGDRRRLEQILVNLVDNGIKFNRPGGHVRVGGSVVEGRPSLWVEDTGVGIPEDSREKVFHRFYRVDKARSREIGGTGLGLAIVKHLMRLHNGQVGLDSELGRGSRFTLEFPPPPSGPRAV